MRLVKSDTYWGRNEVRLQFDRCIGDRIADPALNLYSDRKVDWIPAPPPAIAQQLLAEKRDDFHPMPEFTIFFYRLNVKKKPLDNKLVRQALGLAMNKQSDCRGVTRAGEVGRSQLRSARDPEICQNMPTTSRASAAHTIPRKLPDCWPRPDIPGGAGIEPIPLLANSDDTRQMVGELIQAAWKESLGINARLVNQSGTRISTR